MARYHRLLSESDLADALTASDDEPILLYKHSTTCPISARAQGRIQLLDDDAPPVYEVVVQTSRALSKRIEREFGIQHESPQAILVDRGNPIWDASHSEIREDAIREAAREARSYHEDDDA